MWKTSVIGLATLAAVSAGWIRLEAAPAARSVEAVVGVADVLQAGPTNVVNPKTVELLVTDATTGKPLQGAVVRLFNGVRPTPYVFTDAAGKATVEYPAVGTLTLDVHTERHIQQRVDFNKEKRPAPLTLKLRKGTRSVGGVVVDEEGKPIAGATVRFGAYLGKPQRVAPGILELVCDIDAVTDAQGRWKLEVVDQSPNNLRFSVKHLDYVYLWSNRAAVADILAGTAKTVLRRGVEVRGAVLDEQGKPVAGAELVAAGGREPVIDFSPRVRTGADGAYRFTLDRGRNVVTVQAVGRSPAYKVFERLEKPSEYTFKLPPGRTVKGRVVDPAGKPVAGAYVSAQWGGIAVSSMGGPSLQLWAPTREDGAFELADAPADDCVLRASKTGYLFSEGSPLPPGKTEASLVLTPGPKLRGTVVDAQTGKPIPEFTVGFNFCVIDNIAGKALPAAFGKNLHFTETKGNAGRFELTHSQTMKGEAQVGAWATGYKVARSETFINDAQDREFHFKLEKESRAEVAGAVMLPDGRPAAGAVVVRVMPSNEQRGFTNGRPNNESRLEGWRRCDERGRFSFPPTDEPFVLGASHDGG